MIVVVIVLVVVVVVSDVVVVDFTVVVVLLVKYSEYLSSDIIKILNPPWTSFASVENVTSSVEFKSRWKTKVFFVIFSNSTSLMEFLKRFLVSSLRSESSRLQYFISLLFRESKSRWWVSGSLAARVRSVRFVRF